MNVLRQHIFNVINFPIKNNNALSIERNIDRKISGGVVVTVYHKISNSVNRINTSIYTQLIVYQMKKDDV